jgi:hypothetical protein
MSNDSLWQQLSVKDFLNSCDWNGHKKSSITLKYEEFKLWQLISVANFFNFHNWNGTTVVSSHNHHHFAFSLTLNVPNFWQCFNWTNRVTQSNTSETTSLPSDSSGLDASCSKTEFVQPKQEISVTDLSQLF